MTKLKRIDSQGYFLALLVLGSIFLGSSSIGISFGSFFMFPLRALCIFALPFSIFALLASKNYKLLKLFLVLNFFYAITVGLFFSNKIFIEQLSVLQIGVTISLILIGYINSKKRLLKVFTVLIIGSIAVNSVSFYEIISGKFVLNEMEKGASFYEGMGFLRPISIYTNSNNLAFFNCILSVFILVVLVSKNFFSKRLIFLARLAFILTIASLIFSYSRASIVSCAFVCCYYLIYNAYHNKSLKGLMTTVILACVGVGIMFIVFPSFFNTLFNILSLFQEKVLSSGESGGDETRLSFLEVSFSKMFDNYGFGRGPGFSWNDYHNDRGLVGPHNFLLEIMVDYGVWSLVLFLILLFKTYKKLMGTKKSNARTVLAGSIIAFFLLTLTIGSTIGAPIFWCWLAIINIFTVFDFNETYSE